MTTAEVSARLGVSRAAIARWSQPGGCLPPLKTVAPNHTRIYATEDVERIAIAREVLGRKRLPV